MAGLDISLAATTAEAEKRQSAAANPAHSVWVSASAGSGKTTVLVNRALRLLLEGKDPLRLLCLTFTKVAAAEMATRIAQRLGLWAILDDHYLNEDLFKLIDCFPNDIIRSRARGLFAEIIDCPGGLKIQTIHGFCQSLLGRFPIEAGLSPGFTILEETEASGLLSLSRVAILRDIASGRAPELGEALEIATDLADETSLNEQLDRLVCNRPVMALISGKGNQNWSAELAAYLQADITKSHHDCRADLLVLSRGGREDLAEAARCLEQGTLKTDQPKAKVLRELLEADDPVAVIDEFYGVFFKKRGGLRKNFLTANCAKQFPHAEAILSVLAERAVRCTEAARTAALLQGTVALAKLAAAIEAHYRGEKRWRAKLDYDDLISYAHDLLAEERGSAWVRYKLDGGIDHILVDEAQDTSPKQWAIIAALVDEFFAGDSAVTRERSFFAVGDLKQSIFNFLGADRDEMVRMRDALATRVREAEAGWQAIELEFSYRSTEPVLQAVDATFAAAAVHDGVSEGQIKHLAARQNLPGRVELWPLVPKLVEMVASREADDDDDQATNENADEADAPAIYRLVDALSDKIKSWLIEKRPLPARGPLGARAIRPGDILILVRTRGPLVHALIKGLKQRNIPVAGLDRMILSEQLPVEDVLAAAKFVLLPNDDYNLACLLKSPLLGLDEAALFDLAHARTASLWSELQLRADTNSIWHAAADRLAGWLAFADYTPPYKFFARLLITEGGRGRIVARLGTEADDPLDELLNQALQYEALYPPSLQGFLDWLETSALKIKRENESGKNNLVRIMTVHGAKGLEAPIVILADTTSVPKLDKDPLMIAGLGPLWAQRKDFHDATYTELANAEKIRIAQEYRRLLYVAMTRAADELFIAGCEIKTVPPDCWYRLIENGLAKICIKVPNSLGDWPGETSLLDNSAVATAKPRFDGAEIIIPLQAVSLPAWIGAKPPPEKIPARPLTPSRPVAEPPIASPLRGESAYKARINGQQIHRLLHMLSALPPAKRRNAALSALAQPVYAFTTETQITISEAVLAILDHNSLKDLFGPGSYGEIALSGLVGEQAVTARIDRLLVQPERIVIADFKSGAPPETDEFTPLAYRQQMALYSALLKKIYPGRAIEAWLIWTEGPRLQKLSDAEIIDSALRSLH